MVGVVPADIKINELTNKIYVANLMSGTVSVIDSGSGETKTIRVGLFPESIAIAPLMNKIYVANTGAFRGAGSVSVIDGYNDSKIKDIDVGKNPAAIAYTPNKIYVANTGGTVSVINGATDRKIKDIDLGPNPYQSPEKIVVGFPCVRFTPSHASIFGNNIFVGSDILYHSSSS
jgi:YVTN family beta-propeller protein